MKFNKSNYNFLKFNDEYFKVVECGDNKITVELTNIDLRNIMAFGSSYITFSESFLQEKENLTVELMVLNEAATKFYVVSISSDKGRILTNPVDENILNSDLGKLFTFNAVVGWIC